MKSAVVFGVFLMVGLPGVALTQSAPSWRSAEERPERLDAPPPVEAPDISFEIDRDALFSRPAGYAPAADQARAAPQVIPSKPNLGEIAPQEPEASSRLSINGRDKVIGGSAAEVGPARSAAAATAPDTTAALADVPSAEQPELPAPPKSTATLATNADPGIEPEAAAFVPDSLESSALVSEFGQATEPDQASEADGVMTTPAISIADEQEAVLEAATVNPQQSVASIDESLTAINTLEPTPGPNAAFELVRTKTVAPVYPQDAALAGEQGWVDLRLKVEPSGKVSDVSVVDATPRRTFDKAARRAARQWRYEPPSQSGIAEPVFADIRLNFVLDQ